jgi:carbamoyl-phosphate synthase small subunit
MAGYLKVFTDPSYASQGVVMTYPLIGNYGVIPNDAESKKVWVSGVFVHELAEVSSNFRKEKELNDYLIENEVPGLKNVNTRKLTKVLRNSGTMRGKITSNITNIEQTIKEIKEFSPKNLVGLVSGKRQYIEGEGEKKIALLSFGCKENIIRELKKRNCIVYVYPHDTNTQTLLENNPSRNSTIKWTTETQRIAK